MVYILNTEIKEKKNVINSLKGVFGLGEKKSTSVCKEMGIKRSAKFNTLKKELISRVVNYVEMKHVTGNELRKRNLLEQEMLLQIKNYRGIRARCQLPRRGQRTHTNAKTVKRLKR